MNDRTFDSDDAENQDPDEGEQRSLEDRWRHFLTGEADEERRLRMEKRRERLREERDSEEEPGEERKTEGSDEETAGPPESEGDVEAEPIPDEPDEEGAAGDASPRFHLETDSERGRAGTREERISESRLFATGDEDSGVDEDLGVDAEPDVDEDAPKPRTRAEELRALGKERPGAADPGESAEPGTPSPGPDEPHGGPDESEATPDERGDTPVVIPARDEMDRPAWRRHWKPIAAGAALLLVAIFAVRGIGGGGGGATPDEGASPAGAEAASAVDVDRAEALTDSLEAALGRYRERRQDFDLDRLDCAGLARGYEEVQSALGELRSAVPYADDLAAGPLRSSYRSLVSRVETVEEGYADTGCVDSA